MQSRSMGGSLPGVQSVASIILVAIGGALGAAARFWLSGLVGRRIGETFPWGTLAVNVSGTGMAGFAAGSLGFPGPGSSPSMLWLALVTGVLGSYTTVSSFSLQTLNLLRVGERRHAVGNITASLVLCLVAAASGFALALVVIGD